MIKMITKQEIIKEISQLSTVTRNEWVKIYLKENRGKQLNDEELKQALRFWMSSTCRASNKTRARDDLNQVNIYTEKVYGFRFGPNLVEFKNLFNKISNEPAEKEKKDEEESPMQKLFG